MAIYAQPPQNPQMGGMFGLGSGLYGGAPSGGFMDSFEARMNNPLVAAMMGFGGGMINSAQNGGNFGQGLQSGVGGGLSGALGASRLKRQKMDEEERSKVMRQLIERYAQIGQRSPGVPGGIFASTQPAYPQGMFR